MFKNKHVEGAIPHTNDLLYNTVESRNYLDKSPVQVFSDLTDIVDKAFPKKSAWSFSKHSTYSKQKEYALKLEQVMDLSKPFRKEYKLVA